MTPDIRPATPDDLDVLRGVFRRSSLFYEDGRDVLLAHPEALEFSFPAGGDWECRVAVAGARIVGFATGLFPGGFMELEDLFVEPDGMRRGVGTALVGAMTRVARFHGMARIEVTANPNALDFYEKTGFAVDHTTQTEFGPGLRMHLDLA